MKNDCDNAIPFPCHMPTWPIIRDGLENLKNCSQDPTCTLQEWALKHQEIVNICRDGTVTDKKFHYKRCIFFGLVEFLQRIASPVEKRTFLRSTFPAIVDFALELPNVVPLSGVLYSRQQIGSETVLNKRCIASILACAFLCLFPTPWKHAGSKLNDINFLEYFKLLPDNPSQQAKLRCIFNYFEKVASRRYEIQGKVTFVRQVIPWDELPCMDTWLNCDVELCPLIVHQDGVIEDAGCSAIEVDFANKYIGGGVLGRGRVQEEIRFTVCPELITSLLFMEVMEDNEAIILQGYEQFSKTCGYAGTLQYVGDYTESTMADEDGNFMTTMCAIDAIPFRTDPKLQYLEHYYLRDLNKAFVGFSAKVDRGTTVYPYDQLAKRLLSHDQSESRKESASEEEYMTAAEEEFDQHICGGNVPLSLLNYADGLLVEIMSSALLEAGTELCGKAQKVHIDTNYLDDQSSSNLMNEKPPQDDGMDHLDVDLKDWYLRLRRRSSNLSDVGSRRSSCSTRYSSDFSSEFEEYYDNFQKREQLLGKHHTIKEETCHHVVSEFAANLVSSILLEGTTAAASIVLTMSPVMTEFHNDAPVSVITKPKARKASDEYVDESLTVSNVVVRQFAENFVDNLFSENFFRKEIVEEVNRLNLNIYIPEPEITNFPCLSVAKQQLLLSVSEEEEADRRCHEMATNIVYEVMSEAVLKYLSEQDDRFMGNEDETLNRSVSECSSSPFDTYSNHSESPNVKHLVDSDFLHPVSSILLSGDEIVQLTDDNSTLSNAPYLTASAEKVSSSILIKNNIERVKSPTAEKCRRKQLELLSNNHKPTDVKIGQYHQFVGKNQRKVSFFASSLSRDLLTTAFVEVQRTSNGGSYIRRSSEPLQMSNKAARQLKESINGSDCPKKKTSRTDEDIAVLEAEISQDGPLYMDFSRKYRRESCGFHDETLSRFAEELMKTECKVPELYLFDSSNRSTSGSSSHSWRSSISGFKDQTLARFEEELLASGRPKSRGSLKRKKSGKSSKRFKSKSSEKLSERKGSKGSLSIQQGSETSGLSCYSISSSTPSPPLEELSNFAERLSCNILSECFNVMFSGAKTTCQIPSKIQKKENVIDYAERIAAEILRDVLFDLKDKSSWITWQPIIHSETEKKGDDEMQSFSDEYADALDVPYKRLEEFADVLALNILQRSINVFKREKESTQRKNIGRPIATGNWGCGAFCGDPQLKAMIQWMAASYAGVPYVMYYTFQHDKLTRLQEAVDSILSRGWTVCHLMQAIRSYCQSTFEILEQSNSDSPDLLNVLLHSESFKELKF